MANMFFFDRKTKIRKILTLSQAEKAFFPGYLKRGPCRNSHNSSLQLKTVADIAGMCPCCSSTKCLAENSSEAGLNDSVSSNCDPSALKEPMQKFIAL